MRPSLTVTVLAAGCALVGTQTAPVPPLDREGELVVELSPEDTAPPEIAALFAVRVDGAQFPLRVLLPRLTIADVRRPRMWARGRLEPGHYAGLVLVPVREPGTTSEPEPRHVNAQFTVSGRHATLLRVRLQPPAGAVPPRTLTQVAVYVSSAETNDVAVIDKLTRTLDEIIPLGRGPWGVALDPIVGRAYVALEGDDQISVIDVATGEEQNRIRLNLGDGPRELALTPDRRTLLSVNGGSNTVSFIDAQAMLEIARAGVGQEPTSLLIDRRGARAYVTNQRSSSITVLDLATRTTAGTLSTEDRPLRPQLNRAGDRLYVLHPASAFLLVFSLADLSVAKRVYVGVGNSGLKVDAASDLIYLAKSGDRRISVYDPFSLIPVAGLDAPEGVSYMAIDDAQNALFALSPEQGVLGVVELTHKKLTAVVDVGGSPRVVAIAGERN